MDPNSLRERLAKLHAELDSAHQDNPAARESLRGVLPDIKRMVEQPQQSGAAALSERLEKIAVQFEVDHPTLAASARRLIDLLGEAGI
jgi:Domain of unknown function (DUF4404)